MKNELPVRKNLRLQEFDYNTPGVYFITFCTHNRRNTLSQIVGAIHESPVSRLSTCGMIVDTVIRSVPDHFHITVDRYVIMPNHVHLILMLTESDVQRAIRESPLQGRSLISKVVGYIKMNASRAIRRQYGDVTVWQRGYHDHVIRNRADYEMVSRYVHENPIRWELDKFYTE